MVLHLVNAPRTQTYRYGDPVRVCTVNSAMPPILGDFSYRDYLAREGIHSLIRFANVDVGSPREGNAIRVILLDFRSRAHEMIRRLLP